MANLFPLGALEAAEADVVNENVDEVKFGRSYAFDFHLGEFVLSGSSKVREVEGEDAWFEWCKKALYTQRYRYPIYSRFYGQEFEDLIRLGLNREGNESEIERIVTEALMRDPRTAAVGNFSFTWSTDECYYEFQASNIYESAIILSESVVLR